MVESPSITNIPEDELDYGPPLWAPQWRCFDDATNAAGVIAQTRHCPPQRRQSIQN